MERRGGRRAGFCRSLVNGEDRTNGRRLFGLAEADGILVGREPGKSKIGAHHTRMVPAPADRETEQVCSLIADAIEPSTLIPIREATLA